MAARADVDSVRADAARARQDSIVRARPGYIIDSILPVEEEIRRFQATVAVQPSALSGGRTSRTSLVDAFARALERNDTTALVSMVVDRGEFAYLVYPTSANARPPYRQAPDLVWLTRTASTEKALHRLLGRFGGRPLAYRGFECPDESWAEGENRLWQGCVVRLGDPSGGSSRLRMFGTIVERRGQYKFLSLTNGL